MVSWRDCSAVSDFCEHGFRHGGRRCPECRRPVPERVSVYENRPLLMAGGGDDEDGWEPLGSIDPVTGRVDVSYSRAGGWRPLSEFLWRR